MAEHSKIEWTDATWNPVRGCTKISPGCKHCYAQRFAERFRGVEGHPFEQGFDLRLVPAKIDDPLRWKTPRRIFVNSMSDLFHDRVPLDYIKRVFRVMTEANWHQYQILTKRAERLGEIAGELPWAPHIWMGVSVENEEYLWRIDHLRRTKAHIKFLSIEPLLGPLGKFNLRGIDWVIVGGESGPGARRMHAEWAASIRDQCQEAGVAFFFKQWGGVFKRKTGRELEGRTWDEMPAANALVGIAATD
ncbi:MAG: phage Gp37/Gp68 family protein [Acidobacteriaceae bacterium]|nr:phage Gp37/Gp68 family protein [Acidobacteriaceae bacterium]